MLKAVLPALLLMCAPACADDRAAERIEEAKAVGCRNQVALQASAKMAGETLSERIDRLREMETGCPSEVYGEAMRVDQEAAIEWLKIVASRSETQEN
jgi:hypothetical protein